MTDITPIQKFGDWYAKREDLACFIGNDRPSGSKVRQYLHMATLMPQGTPALVGCSANGSMQIYVADAAARLGVDAHILVPRRKKKTLLTEWSERMGAQVQYLHCGWPNFVRSEARKFAKTLGGCIRWNRDLAIEDTRVQVKDIPQDVRRIVVVLGSGLTACGIMLGLGDIGRSDIELLCVDVCGMINAVELRTLFLSKCSPLTTLPQLPTAVKSEYKYGQHLQGALPDGTPLDCNYAAKCLEFLQAGDMLWVSGMRPLGINI